MRVGSEIDFPDLVNAVDDRGVRGEWDAEIGVAKRWANGRQTPAIQ